MKKFFILFIYFLFLLPSAFSLEYTDYSNKNNWLNMPDKR